MASAPHLLYMFDFVVDDLVITRNNHCAPEEYPTCVEISFRSSVYVSVCDRENGGCVEWRQPQRGKCCIFPLESPVTDEDRLYIHVYKKRSRTRRFLVGLAEMKVKPLFHKVDDEFNKINPEWLSTRQEDLQSLPRFPGYKTIFLDTCECFKDETYKLEKLCPSYVMAKRMLPLFNLCQQQTGNMVLVLRLLCHGPTLVSAFLQVGDKRVPVEPPKDKQPPVGDSNFKSKGYRYFACNVDKLCPYDVCEDEFDRDCRPEPCNSRNSRALERSQTCGDFAAVPKFISSEKKDKKPKTQKNKKKNKKSSREKA